jgi:hypothetical protein
MAVQAARPQMPQFMLVFASGLDSSQYIKEHTLEHLQNDSQTTGKKYFSGNFFGLFYLFDITIFN